MADRFAIYTADFVHAGGTLSLNQIHGSDVMFGQTVDEEFTGGAVDRGWSMLAFAESKGALLTYDLAKVFQTIPLLTGLKCTTGALLRGRRRDGSGTFAAGNVHAVFGSAVGWLCCPSITVSQRRPAEARLDYWSFFNGETKPWTFTKTGAASGMTSPGVNSKYYLGPIEITVGESTVRLTDVQSVEITPGLDFRWIDGDGDVFPTAGAIYARRSQVRFTSNNLDTLNTLAGLYLTEQTNVDIYFRKGAQGDFGRVVDTDAEHARIRIASSAVKPDDIAGRGNDDYGHGFTVLPNGTWTLSAAIAIPVAA